MVASKYRGFSTVNRQGINSELFGVELVMQDLRNHYGTRLGERRHRPNFGSIIHDLLMEPFDDTTQSAVTADARRIIAADPRVQENDLQVILDDDNHAITIKHNLVLVETDMNIEFDVTFKETI